MNAATVPVALAVLGGDGTLDDASKELLSVAGLLGDVHGLWFGEPMPTLVETVARYGVSTLHHCALAAASTNEQVAGAVAAVAVETGADVVLLPAAVDRTEIAARVAHELGAAIVVGATSIARDADSRVVVDTDCFAGTWAVQARVSRPRAVVTLCANAAPALDVGPARAVTVRPQPVPPLSASRVRLVSRATHPVSGRPSLAQAPVVVVGGRGTGGDFGPLEELAELLGGAVGSTKVAVDEGWISPATQVGQTGVSIAPRLYIGAGVSGAIHHRGGMRSSRTIVAINHDPEAPIFEIADVGVVGDLFTVLPALTAELRTRMG